MSRKIILSEDDKNQVLDYIKNTPQCTLRDVTLNLKINREVLIRTFGKDYLNSITFHGCKTTTREKLREANLGKTLSAEIRSKISKGGRLAAAKRDPEEKKKSYDKAHQTKIQKFGSWEEYKEYQVEKTKKTKELRYGDPNFNNIEQGEKTKELRYGDPHYNNKEKARATCEEVYGGIGFASKELKQKYEDTMMERYNVKHNWASKDPQLNSSASRFKKWGSKEEFYNYTLSKGQETKLKEHGDRFWSNREKAVATLIERYGVPTYLMMPECREALKSEETKEKRYETMKKNHTFGASNPEEIVYLLLCEKYGKDDVEKNIQMFDIAIKKQVINLSAIFM